MAVAIDRAMSTSRASPAGWPSASLKLLKSSRSSISTANGAPVLDRLSELALERAVVAQPGQGILLGADADLAVRLGVLHRDRGLAGEELRQLVLVQAEVGILLAHPPDVQRADRLAVDHQRDDDHRLGLVRRPGDLDRAWIRQRVVGQDRLAMVDDPAGDARAQRALVGEDLVREAIAGDDRAPDPGRADRRGRP